MEEAAPQAVAVGLVEEAALQAVAVALVEEAAPQAVAVALVPPSRASCRRLSESPRIAPWQSRRACARASG